MMKFIFILIVSFSAFAQIEKDLLNDVMSTSQGPQLDCLQSITEVQTRAAANCSQEPQLPIGKHRLMKRQFTAGPKGNNLDYETGDFLLRNVSSSKLQAVINIDFKAWKNGSDVDARNMLARTRQCLRNMAPYLRGPDNKQLEVLVLTPDEAETLPENQRPNARVVKVSKEGALYRGNAEEFGTNFDCITIGHEILHHLGLCDEYFEHDPKLATKWSCRPVTVTSSYMRDMWHAFNSTVPQMRRCPCDDSCKRIMGPNSKTKDIFLAQEAYEIIDGDFHKRFCTTSENTGSTVIDELDQKNKAFIVRSTSPTVSIFETRRATTFMTVWKRQVKCICPAGKEGEHCRRGIAEIKKRADQNPKRATCPNGWTQIGDINIGPQSGSTRMEGNELIIVSRGNGESLLRPSHFAKVLAGSCRNPSSSYERCAQYSYIAKGDQCNDMPPECLNDDYFLDGKSIPLHTSH